MLKDIHRPNSNNENYYDLWEQILTLGEINMVLQADSSRF